LALLILHAAITHARAGNIEALENIIANAKGPVSTLTKKVAKAYRHMQEGEWLSASELFMSVVREHARFGGSNAQRDLLDFSLAACLIHQGRTAGSKNNSCNHQTAGFAKRYYLRFTLNADCVDFGDSKCRIGGRGSTQTYSSHQ
jgi:hypothetical protein